MKNYKLGTEKGIRPFSASAERQKKFLVKLFIKRLWVKRSEGKALGPGTPGTITLFHKVYCVILYYTLHGRFAVLCPKLGGIYGGLPYVFR